MARGAGSRREQRERREAQFRAAEQLAQTCPNLVMSRKAAGELKARAEKAKGWIAPDGSWRPHEPGAAKKLKAPKRKGMSSREIPTRRTR